MLSRSASAQPPAKQRPAWQTPALAAGIAVAMIVGGLAVWQPWAASPTAVQQAQTPGAIVPASAPRPTGVAAPRPVAVERPSIAVLPFANLSDDPKQEFFADGLAEDILTALSRFSDLKAIARNSSFRYKGQNPDLRRIGEELEIGRAHV